MLSHKLLGLTLAICFISSLFFVESISAEDERESIVDANFDIEIESATDLKISVTMEVSEITVFDKTYSNAEIHSLATSANLSDVETIGAIKLKLRNLLKQQIEKTFENASVNALNEKPTYKNTNFNDAFSVNLTYTFFKLSESVNTYNLINGILDMDAVVSYDFNLQAEHGWNNTYTIIMPDFLKYRHTTGAVDSNKVQWRVKNRDGNNPSLPAEISIQYTEPTTTSIKEENISLEIDLDATNVNLLDLKISIIAKTIDIRNYEILPNFINELDFVPSDGMRLFIDNHLLDWDDIYNTTFKPIEQLSLSTIENSSFNQTLDTLFLWDPETTTICSNPYNITKMNEDPPIITELIDENVHLTICDMSNRAFFGLINSGAKANITVNDIDFGDGLSNIGRPYNIYLHLPDNITIDKKNIFNWNQSIDLLGEVISDISPEYSNEEIDTYIEIDISKMDLDLPSFFTGKTKLTTTSHIQEDTDIYLTRFPGEFNINEKIILPYLNSDAFRLCIEENVITTEELDVFLTNKKVIFNSRLSNILKNIDIQGVVDKDAFYESLKWDGDIAYMDKESPIRTSVYSHNIYPTSFNLSFWPPGIRIFNQTFAVRGLENHPVTYRIIFPQGISVKARDTQNKTIIQGETKEKRAYVEVSFDTNEIETDIITCEITTSSLYLVGMFVPCGLSLILVIILIAIVFFIRKKKKRGKTKKEEPEPSGYEDQDYYVPPPPSSK